MRTTLGTSLPPELIEAMRVSGLLSREDDRPRYDSEEDRLMDERICADMDASLAAAVEPFQAAIVAARNIRRVLGMAVGEFGINEPAMALVKELDSAMNLMGSIVTTASKDGEDGEEAMDPNPSEDDSPPPF